MLLAALLYDLLLISYDLLLTSPAPDLFELILLAPPWVPWVPPVPADDFLDFDDFEFDAVILIIATGPLMKNELLLWIFVVFGATND